MSPETVPFPTKANYCLLAQEDLLEQSTLAGEMWGQLSPEDSDSLTGKVVGYGDFKETVSGEPISKLFKWSNVITAEDAPIQHLKLKLKLHATDLQAVAIDDLYQSASQSQAFFVPPLCDLDARTATAVKGCKGYVTLELRRNLSDEDLNTDWQLKTHRKTPRSMSVFRSQQRGSALCDLPGLRHKLLANQGNMSDEALDRYDRGLAVDHQGYTFVAEADQASGMYDPRIPQNPDPMREGDFQTAVSVSRAHPPLWEKPDLVVPLISTPSPDISHVAGRVETLLVEIDEDIDRLTPLASAPTLPH